MRSIKPAGTPWKDPSAPALAVQLQAQILRVIAAAGLAPWGEIELLSGGFEYMPPERNGDYPPSVRIPYAWLGLSNAEIGILQGARRRAQTLTKRRGELHQRVRAAEKQFEVATATAETNAQTWIQGCAARLEAARTELAEFDAQGAGGD